MATINDLDIWREIPPEEKLEIMARSQAKGISACLLTVVVCATLSISLKYPWVFWGAMIFTPFTFQFSSNKAWRALRPAMVLRYLAARSVTRRYAYSAARSRDLSLQVIFPATVWRDELMEKAENEDELKKLKNKFSQVHHEQKVYEVWVALFKDSIVCITESPVGAKLLFAAPINTKVSISSISESGSDYDHNKEVLVKQTTVYRDYYWRIRSRYPAALIVFEKQATAALRAKEELLAEE